MGNDFKVIKGKTLSRLGLWFFLTYLYSQEIDHSEVRYKLRANYSPYARQIDKLKKDKPLMKEWLLYACTKFKRRTKNDGNVSFNEQKKYAKELLPLFE